MTAPYDLLLARLEGVRAYRAPAGDIDRSARAYCPAHQIGPHRPGRGRTLSIAERGDVVLVHCHGGCGAADVLAAVGLSLHDLYPRRGADCGPHYSTAHMWTSAAAAADALTEAVETALVCGDAESLASVWGAVAGFRGAARAAMRSGGGV
ncbi:MAG: hypothetical protein ACYCQK_09090 [Acidiferrobacteraceae bacterium]